MLLIYINYFFKSVKLIQQIKLHFSFKKTPVVHLKAQKKTPVVHLQIYYICFISIA
jgi:hypothetical protein